jgi:UDP-N-acetylmuramate dehydrogenase
MGFSHSVQHIVRENEPLAPHSWLQIGGNARYFAEPNTLDELQTLLVEAGKLSLPTRILGGGSNILIRESGYQGLVLSLSTAEFTRIESFHDEETGQGTLTARAGAALNHAISKAVGAGLGGLEHLAGIPGSIGGALVSNAGVTNDDIGSRVRRVTVVDSSGELTEKLRDDLQFGFRRSNLEDAIIVEVEFALEPADAAELTRRMQTNWIVKRAAQPQSGSRTIQAFIEPDGTSIADALETAGMKGASNGEASLNPNFPGYLTVTGDATSDQVIALMEKVIKAVEIRSGIQLQSQLKIW